MIRKWLEKRRGQKEVLPNQLLTPAEEQLNEEMGYLHNVTDYLPYEEHRVVYRGLFMNIMRIIQTMQPEADTETHARQVLQIVKEAQHAGKLRRDRLLPAGRENTDYRKYKNVYTHALVSAVAVEGAISAAGGMYVPPGVVGLEDWLNDLSEDSEQPRGGPALWLRVILPKQGLDWLQEDSMVWADWLAYFEAPESSAMAEISQQAKEWIRTGIHPANKMAKPFDSQAAMAKIEQADAAQRGATVAQPKLAGWEVIEAIKVSLSDGSLLSGQPESIVQVDCDGRTFLRVPEIYEWYQEHYDPETTTKTIRNRVKKIGVFERIKAKEIYKAIVTRGGVPVEGVVLKSSALLWGKESPTGSIVIQGMKGPL